MVLKLVQCEIDDLEALRELSYRTYNDTFGSMNTPENMKVYLDKAFDINKLRDELLNSSSWFYFLYTDGEVAGYLKLNECKAQSDIKDEESLEVERIYIAKEHQGKGLGTVLLDKAIKVAQQRRKSYLWLGVWEKNDKALQFYISKGFYRIGKHSFFMGDDEQTDFIMKKDLSNAKD